MSHKQCSCNDCLPVEKPGDDKLFKKLMEKLEPKADSSYSSEVCDHNKLLIERCGLCADEFDNAINIFVTKDSGKRQEFSTGMVRDTNTGKPRYDLLWQPGIKRLAELMARGAVKYSARNWEKASTQEELDRFVESAARHFHQWLQNETDEDHMSATVFNLFGAEMVREKLRNEK